MIQLRHGLYLTVHLMLFNILVQPQMNPDLLNGVKVLVQSVFSLEDLAESARSQLSDLFETFAVPFVLEVLFVLIVTCLSYLHRHLVLLAGHIA